MNLSMLEREEVCIKAFQQLDKAREGPGDVYVRGRVVGVGVVVCVCEGGGGRKRRSVTPRAHPAKVWAAFRRGELPTPCCRAAPQQGRFYPP